MYAGADVTRPVEITTDSEKYNVEQGSKRLPNIPDVPYLGVMAALNDGGDTLSLFCVNRHLTKDIATKISIEGFKPASEATGETLFASSIFEKNDEVNPEAVHPKYSSARLNGSVLEYSVRHESVTVLTVHGTK
jgi:alpha-N-arabinofuranosidase